MFVYENNIVNKENFTVETLGGIMKIKLILEDGKVVKSTMTNKKITGTLEFTKVDFSTSEPLPNTTIEIYNSNDTLIYSGKTDSNCKIIINKLITAAITNFIQSPK